MHKERVCQVATDYSPDEATLGCKEVFILGWEG